MSLRSESRLLRLGVTAELRNTGLRLLGASGLIGSAALAWSHGPIAGSTAIFLSDWLARIYGVAACLWFAYAANRDQTEQEGGIYRCKPVDGARWVLQRWAAGFSAWLVLLAVAFAGAALAQLPSNGLASLVAHGLGFLRAAILMAGPVTLSLALSRMMRSPLGGVITVFAWFCAMAGLSYIPHFLQPDLAQNSLLFLGTAAFLLGLSALLVERFRRGELRRPLVPALAVAALAGFAAAGAAAAYRSVPDTSGTDRTSHQRLARQYISEGKRLPGFWLPDGRGGTVRTAPHHGKILLVYLFAADDMEAARMLRALDEIRAEYGSRGVQPIGICLSPDQGDGPALSLAGGYGFPIAYDPNTLRTSPPESPVAIAYHAEYLPLLAITDRSRRVRNLIKETGFDAAFLKRFVEERLAAEPQ